MKNNRVILLLIILAAILVLCIRAYYFYPYYADDSYITLRYAQRLIDGYGLTWNNGVPVEGYSNLSWTLIMAGLGSLGMDMELATRLLGLALSIAIIGLLVYYIKTRYNGDPRIVAIVLAFFSICGIVSVWSIAGLEQPLVAFLALLAIIKLFDYRDYKKNIDLIYSSLALGLLCITRPDGIMLSFILGAYLFIINKSDNKKALTLVAKLAIFPFIFYFGQLAFRIYYYGELVPNTALVKVTPSYYHAWIGLRYTLRFLRTNSSLVIITFGLAILLYKNRQKNLYLLSTILLLWFAYLSFIGGDIFDAFRHHFYSLVFILVLLADGLNNFFKSEYYQKWNKGILLGLLIVLFSYFVYRQFTDSRYIIVKNLNIAYHHLTLAKELKATFSEEQPLVALDAAGVVPYTTKFPALDMLGLNDYHIARNKPKTMGKGFIGHELGDPEYTLDQNPDIIQMDYGVRVPVRYIDSMLYINKRFQDNYRDINVFAKSDNEYDYEGVLWFNLYSTKVGIKYTNECVIIPAYFLNNDTTVYSEFKKGELLLPIKPNQQFELILPFLMHSDTVYSNPAGVQIRYTTEGKNTIITAKNTANKTRDLKEVIVK
ncbi:MAG: hypothetical protein WC121_09685 [Candidatus Kapaibacterium sp.]